MSKKSLEHIIQQKFEGASSDIPSGVWSGLESQLGPAGSSAGGFVSGLGGKIALGVAAASVAIGSLFVIPSSEPTPSAKTSENDVVNTIPAEVNENESKTDKVSPKSQEKTALNQEKKKTTVLIDDSRHFDQNEEPLVLEPLEEIEVDFDMADFEMLKPEPVSENSGKVPDYKPTKTVTFSGKITSRKNDFQSNNYTYSLSQELNRVSVNWYINDELLDSGAEFNHTFTHDDDFTVMATVLNDSGEEIGRDILLERVESIAKLVVPNVITPNQDGVNEVFDIDHDKSENIFWYSIMVMTDDGSPIFESSNEQKHWEGYFLNGTPALQGKYYYLIKYKTRFGEIQTKTGIFTLKR